MARPTIYNEEILVKAKEYLELCTDGWKLKRRPELSKEGEIIEKSELKYEVKLPSIEGLAAHLGIHKDTFYEWEQVHSEFSDVLVQIRALQAERLINQGLAGNYNSTIAKLLLMKHGYSDKQELTGKDGEKLEMGVVILPSKNAQDDLRTS